MVVVKGENRTNSTTTKRPSQPLSSAAVLSHCIPSDSGSSLVAADSTIAYSGFSGFLGNTTADIDFGRRSEESDSQQGPTTDSLSCLRSCLQVQAQCQRRAGGPAALGGAGGRTRRRRATNSDLHCGRQRLGVVAACPPPGGMTQMWHRQEQARYDCVQGRHSPRKEELGQR